MGHADIQTMMKYLHYESRPEDAQLVAEAFASSVSPEPRTYRGPADGAHRLDLRFRAC